MHTKDEGAPRSNFGSRVRSILDRREIVYSFRLETCSPSYCAGIIKKTMMKARVYYTMTMNTT